MSLSTKQRRGSAVNVGLPWRNWVSEPSGISEFGDRLVFVHYAFSPTGTELGGGLACGEITVSPLLTGTVSIAGLLTGKTKINKECN